MNSKGSVAHLQPSNKEQLIPATLSAEQITLLGKIVCFIERHPGDGNALLDAFLVSDGRILLDTRQVAAATGWSDAWIHKLAKRDILPHIPGNPNKFLLNSVMKTLEDLLIGGGYGRRRSTLKLHDKMKKK